MSEDTEAKKGSVTFPRLHSWNLSPCTLALDCGLLSTASQRVHTERKSNIDSFNKYLLSAYTVPGTTLECSSTVTHTFFFFFNFTHTFVVNGLTDNRSVYHCQRNDLKSMVSK